MKSLNEDIKTGQFKNIYLLYGEEAYLKRQYKDKLVKAMLPPGDTMNYAHFEGKEVHIPEIIDLAETMPFFSDRRLIVIEDSGFFKRAVSDLAEYLRQLPETTVLLFVEQEIDKRGKLYKAVKDKGRAVELGRQDEKTLTRWILGLVKKEGKQIRERTLQLLLSKAGTDMENLEQELEKLFCYTMDRDEITYEDVEAICTTQLTNQIFAMVDAVASQNSRKALDYYYDLLALKESPMRILAMLNRQFRLLLEVQDLMKRGLGRKQIAQEAGIHPFAAGKYMDQCRSFPTENLRAAMEEGAQLEQDAKTGRISDVMSVEIFIMQSKKGR